MVPRFTGPPNLVNGPAGRLAVREQSGDGPPLVLVHGINMNALVWEDVATAMPSRQILAPDLRGHGASDHRGPFSVDDWAADVLAVVAAYELERVQLAGVSLGGMIVCLIAQQRPELVQSALAFGSAVRGEHPDIEGGMVRLRKVGIDAYFSAASALRSSGLESTRLARLAASDGRSTETTEAVTRAGFASDLTHRIHPSGRRVLIVSGELDGTCTPQAGRELAAAAGGEWHLMPGVGHVIPIENPTACATLIQGVASEIG